MSERKEFIIEMAAFSASAKYYASKDVFIIDEFIAFIIRVAEIFCQMLQGLRYYYYNIFHSLSDKSFRLHYKILFDATDDEFTGF